MSTGILERKNHPEKGNNYQHLNQKLPTTPREKNRYNG